MTFSQIHDFTNSRIHDFMNSFTRMKSVNFNQPKYSRQQPNITHTLATPNKHGRYWGDDRNHKLLQLIEGHVIIMKVDTFLGSPS